MSRWKGSLAPSDCMESCKRVSHLFGNGSSTCSMWCPKPSSPWERGSQCGCTTCSKCLDQSVSEREIIKSKRVAPIFCHIQKLFTTLIKTTFESASSLILKHNNKKRICLSASSMVYCVLSLCRRSTENIQIPFLRQSRDKPKTCPKRLAKAS